MNNPNIEELKRIASEIAKQKLDMKNIKNKSVIIDDTPQVSPDLPVVSPTPQSPSVPTVQSVQPVQQTPVSNIANALEKNVTYSAVIVDKTNNFFNIFGLAIPKNTTYFIFVLLVIALGIWYYTNYMAKKDDDD